MFRMLFLVAALLGVVSVAHAEPEVRRIPQKLASKDVVSVGDSANDVSSPGATEDTTRTLRVGDVDVVVPLLKGYRGIDALSDLQRRFAEQTTLPAMQLLDVHLHEEMDSMAFNEFPSHVNYHMIVVRSLSQKHVDRKGWNDLRSLVMPAMGKLDLAAWMERSETRTNDVLREHGVDTAKIEGLHMDKPKVYRFDERSIRVVLMIETQQTVEGQSIRVQEIRATATVLARGKVFSVMATKEFPAGEANPDEVIQALDAYADRVLALNP